MIDNFLPYYYTIVCSCLFSAPDCEDKHYFLNLEEEIFQWLTNQRNTKNS